MNRLLSPIRHAFVREESLLGFGWVGGILLFVILSGLAVWALPFGVTAQMAVLLHTAVGVILVVVFTIWQLSHWLATRKTPRRLRKISAYTGFWLLALSVVTGMMLTLQAVFRSYVSPVWSQVHLWSGMLALPFLVYHVLPHAQETAESSQLPAALTVAGSRRSYAPARRRMWELVGLTSAALLLLLVGAALAHRGPSFASYEPPSQYRAAPGQDPFRPSLARTSSGRPLDPRLLGNSDSCGATGCHRVIYQEWLASAHHWSSEDHFFQSVRSATTEVRGVHETEKCAGCHEPVSLLSGYKTPTLGSAAPGYREGDSCVVCHAVSGYDERGIGSYVLRVTKPYLYEHSGGRYARALNHFLIRAYPEQHDRDYDLTIVRKPESCAPCHKEYDVFDKKEGPVEVEAQFDEWKSGRWNTAPNPADRLYCQQCHIYYETTPQPADADPYDLKTGLGCRHRNHYFAAANQYLPSLLSSADAAGQVRRVESWLRGERVVPEIEKVCKRGAVVSLKILAPRDIRPGQAAQVRILLTNEKAGHNFPTGPLNIIRSWVEVVVRDKDGRGIFHSGQLDARGHIEAGSIILKPTAIDTRGRAILEPDVWHPKGPIYRPSIAPGHTGTYDYEFRAPAKLRAPLTVTARLRYRKANQFFMEAAFPDQNLMAPVTDISTARIEIAAAVGRDGPRSVASRR